MTRGSKLIYVDTNVLAYTANTKAVQHQAALKVFQVGKAQTLCISSQVMAELYAYLTNQKILENPLTPEAARLRLRKICQLPNVTLLLPTENFVEIWLELTEERPVKGGKVFDLLHIATMLGNGITSIYTFNGKDFDWYPGLEVIDPSCL